MIRTAIISVLLLAGLVVAILLATGRLSFLNFASDQVVNFRGTLSSIDCQKYPGTRPAGVVYCYQTTDGSWLTPANLDIKKTMDGLIGKEVTGSGTLYHFIYVTQIAQGGSANLSVAILNGGFENWSNGLPVSWSAVPVGKDKIIQSSTDHHSGQHSLELRKGRVFSSQPFRLSPGTYHLSIWEKIRGAESNISQINLRGRSSPSDDWQNFGRVNLTATESWKKVTSPAITLSRNDMVYIVSITGTPELTRLLDDVELVRE